MVIEWYGWIPEMGQQLKPRPAKPGSAFHSCPKFKGFRSTAVCSMNWNHRFDRGSAVNPPAVRARPPGRRNRTVQTITARRRTSELSYSGAVDLPVRTRAEHLECDVLLPKIFKSAILALEWLAIRGMSVRSGRGQGRSRRHDAMHEDSTISGAAGGIHEPVVAFAHVSPLTPQH
jgi:hypothetical protein